MGSYMMLSDENTLNNINPFVIEGPGAKNKPFGYAPVSQEELPVSWDTRDSDDPTRSTCILGNTNGSFLSNECVPIKNPEKCYLHRPLEPTRDIVPDLYTLLPYTEPSLEQQIESKQLKTKLFVIGIILLVLIFLLYPHIVKRL